MSIRKIIEIDKTKCDACGECIPSCAEQALIIENNELIIREDKLCDGLGACLNACPKNALKIIEREADAFDHDAVEKLIKCKSLEEPTEITTISHNTEVTTASEQVTVLQNWPIKLSLVSLNAKFLDSETLTLVADCAGFACSSFHKRYTKKGPILILCPRLEEKPKLIEKIALLFKEKKFKHINIVRMEVPCCAIPDLVMKAIDMADYENPPKVNLHVLARNGSEHMPKLFNTLRK